MDPEETKEEELLDTCPACGEQTVNAVCEVIVEYTLENERGDQNWVTDEVDDDTSKPLYFRCTSCRKEFHRFRLNEQGYLVELTDDEPPKPTTDPEFRAWLKQRMARFFEVPEDDSAFDDESLDCGDMWREIEDGGELAEIGVRCAWDHEGQTMFFSGRDAEGEVWVIGSQYELGIEGETVWLNPLCNLQWGEGVIERVNRAAERMHERADALGMLTV